MRASKRAGSTSSGSAPKKAVFNWAEKREAVKTTGGKVFGKASHKEEITFFRARPILYNGDQTGNDEAQWKAKFSEKDAVKTAMENAKAYLMQIKPGQSTWQGEYNRCRVLTGEGRTAPPNRMRITP